MIGKRLPKTCAFSVRPDSGHQSMERGPHAAASVRPFLYFHIFTSARLLRALYFHILSNLDFLLVEKYSFGRSKFWPKKSK